MHQIVAGQAGGLREEGQEEERPSCSHGISIARISYPICVTLCKTNKAGLHPNLHGIIPLCLWPWQHSYRLPDKMHVQPFCASAATLPEANAIYLSWLTHAGTQHHTHLDMMLDMFMNLEPYTYL